MKRIENHCVGCAVPAYPCIGNACPNRRVLVYYCDECKNEITTDVNEVDGQDLCNECFEKLTINLEEE